MWKAGATWAKVCSMKLSVRRMVDITENQCDSRFTVTCHLWHSFDFAFASGQPLVFTLHWLVIPLYLWLFNEVILATIFGAGCVSTPPTHLFRFYLLGFLTTVLLSSAGLASCWIIIGQPLAWTLHRLVMTASTLCQSLFSGPCVFRPVAWPVTSA